MLYGLFSVYAEKLKSVVVKPSRLILNPREYIRRERENMADLVELDEYSWMFKLRENTDDCMYILRPINPSFMDVEVLSYGSQFEI